ncbi:MAG TPA: histidine kinase, partial [Euzebyales bacterium]|nr:histidine kinase [Euzebyales bacterium]
LWGRSLAETAPPSSPLPERVIAGLVRLVIDYRLLTVLLSTVHSGAVGAPPILAFAFVGIGVANLLALLRWDRVAGALLRHPALLAVDVLLSIAMLLITGFDGPLLSYTLGTAFIAGLLYAWTGAGVFALVLVASYWALLTVQSPMSPASLSSDVQAVVGTPSLYVLIAVGGAAVRNLLVGQARTEEALRAAREQAAHAEERARLAREMHDTLGKTLHGIGLLSGALPTWVQRDPRRAVREARVLAAAAQDAAAQARQLQSGLRADHLVEPLDQVVRSTAELWAQQHGAVDLHLDLQPTPGLDPWQRSELLEVLREALCNVQRHARARRVWVELLERGHAVSLRVRDDGCGLPGTYDPDRLAAGGHFGLVGMRERVQRVGGWLAVAANQPSGVTITAEVPSSAPDRPLPAGVRRPGGMGRAP